MITVNNIRNHLLKLVLVRFSSGKTAFNFEGECAMYEVSKCECGLSWYSDQVRVAHLREGLEAWRRFCATGNSL